MPPFDALKATDAEVKARTREILNENSPTSSGLKGLDSAIKTIAEKAAVKQMRAEIIEQIREGFDATKATPEEVTNRTRELLYGDGNSPFSTKFIL